MHSRGWSNHGGRDGGQQHRFFSKADRATAAPDVQPTNNRDQNQAPKCHYFLGFTIHLVKC